jgi:phosphonate transport system substrate-binding protein
MNTKGFFMDVYVPLISAIFLLIVDIHPCFADNTASYSLGIVPQFEARKLREIWQPVVNYVNQKTGYTLKIQGSPEISEFEEEVLKGRFDFAYMNPYHFILANESNNYIPVVRDISTTLQGIIVVKKDGPFKKITDLNNQVIAFPAPNALGASLLTRQALQEVFHQKFTAKYVKTHDSVYLSVLLGTAAAGGGIKKTLRRQPLEYIKALRIIYTTQGFAPHPLAVHPRVPEPVVTAVKNALLSLGETQAGKTLLEKIPIKQIGVASMQDYLPLKDLNLERFYQP